MMIQIEVIKDCGIGKKGKIIAISDSAAHEALKLGLVKILDEKNKNNIYIDNEFADGIVKEGNAEYVKSTIEISSIDTKSRPESTEKKLKSDVQHRVVLAAKESGKDQQTANQLGKKFYFEYIKNCQEPESILEAARKFCEYEKLQPPNLPTVEKKETKPTTKKRKKENDEPYDYAASGETEEDIYEIIYQPKQKQTKFVKYHKNPGNVEIVDDFRDDLGNLIKPYPADEFEELLKNGVILPDGIEDYESIEQLQKEIQEFIHKWVDVDERFEKFASYYVMLTWVYEKANSLVYLRLKGPHGMGKSRFLKTVGQICFRAMPGGGAVGAAPIFRKMDRWHGTLLMDEADFKNSDESADIIKIINCGFEKGTPVERCDQVDASKLRFFDVFGPKILCTRKEWADSATESRCLTHNVYMTTRKDIKDSINLEFYNDQTQLRRKLLMFRFRKMQTIDFDKALEIDLGPIEPRLRQTNRAFAALFIDDDTLQAEFKQFLLEYAKELSEQLSESYEGLVVNALINLGLPPDEENAKDFIAPAVSASDIYQYMQNEGMLSQKSKTSARSIGKVLRSLGFKSEVRKVDGKAKRCLIFEKAHLESVLPRYISDSGKLRSYICYNAIEERGGNVTNCQNPDQKTLNFEKLQNTPVLHTHVTNVTSNSNVTKTVPQEVIEEEFISYAAPGEIHHKCNYCGLTPCVGFDRKGRPICELCMDNPNIKK